MSKHKSEDEGPHECKIENCFKVFKHRSGLLAHISFVHTDSKYICDFERCGKVFKHKKSLDEHKISQHEGIENYSCPFCGRKFKSNSNMHSHKKRAHPEEYKLLPVPSYKKIKK
jgi:uncharacterized C2H2 Zn-finger protein